MARRDEVERVNRLQDEVADKHIGRLKAAIEASIVSVADKLPFSREPDPAHSRVIEDTMRALYQEITQRTAADMVDRFKSGYQWIETKADESGFYQRIFEQYLQAYGAQKIGQVNETTRRQIVRMIERGLKEGLSVDQIAEALRERAPELSEIRAAIIARTETHSASMFASMQSAKRSTLPLVKEWVSVEDGRTRDFGEGDGVVDDFSHRAMDGVQVPIDEPFEVPTAFGITEKLMFPGDPAGSPGNIINCRCAQTYETADEGEDVEPSGPPPAPAGDARARLLDQIQGNVPIVAQNTHGAFDDAPEIMLQAIAKGPDLNRVFFDRKDGAYYLQNSISMGTHAPGSAAYARVWRHEYGHALDARIGATTGNGEFSSWAARQQMHDDGKELLAARSALFGGDKRSAMEIANRNRRAHADRWTELEEQYDDGDTLLRDLIPEVEPADIWRMYGADDAGSRSLSNAAQIAAAWERRDVAEAIANLPTQISGRRVAHSSGFAGLQDTFEASTGGNIRIVFGHGKNYYTDRNPISELRGQTERFGRQKWNAFATGQAFANWTEARGSPNPADYALYKRLFPRMAAAFEELLEEYVNA